MSADALTLNPLDPTRAFGKNGVENAIALAQMVVKRDCHAVAKT